MILSRLFRPMFCCRWLPFSLFLLHSSATVCAAAPASYPADSQIRLPAIGVEQPSGVVRQKERALGRQLLGHLYAQNVTSDDPLLVDYCEHLVHKLAEFSELPDRQLSVVVLKDWRLNAFAAPGGVIGLHAGLFLHAAKEGELAGVIAHELAHLSQQHYARSVEEARRLRLPTVAAVIGSIALSVTGLPLLGLASLSTALASSQSDALAFSRQNEREADRIGSLTMARAGLDPRSMVDLFERLHQLDSSGPQYEFLYSHPTSRSRINDIRQRAEQYPTSLRRDRTLYHIVRNRVILRHARSPEEARARFASEVSSLRTPSQEASRYALALSLFELNRLDEAAREIAVVVKKSPQTLPYQVLSNRIEFAAGHSDSALKKMQNLLDRNPGNLQVVMVLANLLRQAKQFGAATTLLKKLSRQRSDDPAVWYELAETAGLGKEPLTVHTARAEFFVLVGNAPQALRQLQYVLELPGISFIQKSRVSQRMEEIRRG